MLLCKIYVVIIVYSAIILNSIIFQKLFIAWLKAEVLQQGLDSKSIRVMSHILNIDLICCHVDMA